MTYKEMMKSEFSSKDYLYTSYKWIQVDEVQDLNPLQLAIYSFLGANHGSIVSIEAKCGSNVFNLSNNYRSPMYLLDMLNDYARTILKCYNS